MSLLVPCLQTHRGGTEEKGKGLKRAITGLRGTVAFLQICPQELMGLWLYC